MTAGRRMAAPLLLLAALCWLGRADAAGPAAPQSRPPPAANPSSSPWCIAKCNELVAACKAFENRHPSCSPSDICLDEKLRCEAQCPARVTQLLSAGR